MALSIKSEEADRLARALAAATGETITEAVTAALRERLDREQRPTQRIRTRLAEIRLAAQQLDVLDTRLPAEILGYDDHGLPT